MQMPTFIFGFFSLDHVAQIIYSLYPEAESPVDAVTIHKINMQGLIESKKAANPPQETMDDEELVKMLELVIIKLNMRNGKEEKKQKEAETAAA